MAGSEPSDHHGSHRDLLWSLEDPSSLRRRVDAIIVPTFRPPAYLSETVRLAMSLDCPLVTLHSGKWTSASLAARRLPAGLDLIAIDVPEAARLRLPDLETSRLLAGSIFARRTDLSPKRNLALVLSRRLGWSRVIFIDDDITELNPDHMRQAVGLLDTHNAVGLVVGGYPDHSVVCHAFREAGGAQQSFIGGGALAIEVKRSQSFFPDIYNDDWFFMLDAKKGLQPVASTGRVIQQAYEPFRTPDRARAEELGDVLAEGIYWLLDKGKSLADADLRHWTSYLVTRRHFIEQVIEMVEKHNFEPGDKARRIAALKGALGRLACIAPDLCHDYLRAWAGDRERWQRHIQQVPTRQPLGTALDSLSRKGSPHLTWHAPGSGDHHALGPTRSPRPRAGSRNQWLPVPAEKADYPEAARRPGA